MLTSHLQYARCERLVDALRRIRDEVDAVHDLAWGHLGPVEQNPEVDDRLRIWADQARHEVDDMLGKYKEHARRHLNEALRETPVDSVWGTGFTSGYDAGSKAKTKRAKRR